MVEEKIIHTGNMGNEANNTKIENMTFTNLVIDESDNIVFNNVIFEGDLSIAEDTIVSNCKFINCTIPKFDSVKF